MYTHTVCIHITLHICNPRDSFLGAIATATGLLESILPVHLHLNRLSGKSQRMLAHNEKDRQRKVQQFCLLLSVPFVHFSDYNATSSSVLLQKITPLFALVITLINSFIHSFWGEWGAGGVKEAETADL